jgi:lipoprotein-anchoring transpeptidase ErfK/SrfK
MRWWLAFVSLSLATAATAATQEPLAPAPTGPAKRVEVDKATQTLRAYEGDRLILESRVSTGKWDKSTPNGEFQAGVKDRMHYSRLFDQAPMPFSVQVHGDVFIHGFTSVPRHPASHGCIRLPLDHGNPAKKFFDWVEPGTPIEIKGHWEGRK